MLVATVAALLAAVAARSGLLQLFMDPATDADDAWGLLVGAPSALSRADGSLSPPPANYTAGATVFASFVADAEASGETVEVFVAVGRPGEPIATTDGDASHRHARDQPGVSVLRFTTRDFVSWSQPTTALFLPDGAPPAAGGFRDRASHPDDGDIWTCKSVDRNETHYLMIAYYGAQAAAFVSPRDRVSTEGSFSPIGPVFMDHDDTNIIFSTSTRQWVDMQIFGAPWLLPNGSRTVCPHNLSDNGGCDGGPRTVTVRTSTDGRAWTGDFGCSSPGRHDPIEPTKRPKCAEYNESGLIRPSPTEDPPELQFYRLRPFYVGDSGRLAGHTLQYAASPAEVNNVSNYGYWGPYCPSPDGSGFIMCHKGHGYGRMHGPHIMEEWWIGAARQAGPEDLGGWLRPFKRFRIVPQGVWLMSQPVVHSDQHVWVADTGVFTVPLYRIAGVSAPANAEFSSRPFAMPGAGQALWLNVDASWQGGLVTGGCDEGCAAYVMVEMQHAGNGSTVPGFGRGGCMLMNVTGLRVPLTWQGSPRRPPAGTPVKLRFYFRDATIYALGSG